MIRAGVVGATGYAGAELVRILSGHPDVDLSIITSRSYKGVPFAEVFPAMSGVVSLVCEDLNFEKLCDTADIIFTALPHKLPMEIIPKLIKKGKRVIDLSADFRFRDVKIYEKFYQAHTAQDLLKTSVYGLSEVYTDEIKKALVIGNPGCYPTSVLLPLIPLLKTGIIDSSSIIIDSKSGVSGAGRSVSLTTHFCEVNESFKAYKVTGHRHCPEMEEVLSHEAGKSIHISFVPHLIPVTRGMLSTIYSTLKQKTPADEIRKCLSSFYSGRLFIRICPDNILPDISYVNRTNFCDIGIKIDEANNRLIIISVIDNLIKGAAGQAVQNMNIMLGLDETKGLNAVPYAV